MEGPIPDSSCWGPSVVLWDHPLHSPQITTLSWAMVAPVQHLETDWCWHTNTAVSPTTASRVAGFGTNKKQGQAGPARAPLAALVSAWRLTSMWNAGFGQCPLLLLKNHIWSNWSNWPKVSPDHQHILQWNFPVYCTWSYVIGPYSNSAISYKISWRYPSIMTC